MPHIPAIRPALMSAFALSLLGTTSQTLAASADPDSTFDGDGVVIHAADFFDVPPTDYFVIINAATTQPDGKIVVAGDREGGAQVGGVTPFQSFIARFNENGSLDTSFSGDGYLIDDVTPGVNNAAWEVLVQADGKIIVAGHTASTTNSGDAFVIRYDENGVRDASFGGGDGLATITQAGSSESVLGMVLRPDGRIVIAGSSNTNGAIDSFFAQLTDSGNPDSDFGGDGTIVHQISSTKTDFASGLDLYPDGKLAFTGNFDSSTNAAVLVGRLNANGSLDTSFNSTGNRVIDLRANLRDFGDELLIQPDGSLLLAVTVDDTISNSASLGVLKLNTNGSTDATFGNSVTPGLTLVAPDVNRSIFNATELARLPDGKILVAGSQAQMIDATTIDSTTAKVVVARLTATGALDTSFDVGSLGVIRTNIGLLAARANTISLQGDGKLLIAGRALNTAGTPFNSYLLVRLSVAPIDELDTTPDAINFGTLPDVIPNSLQTSNTQTVSGISSGVQVPVRVTNGSYKLNNGSFTSDPGWAISGDEIQLQHNASGLGDTVQITTLSVGGVATQFNGDIVQGTPVIATFVSHTEVVDTIPDAFTLTDRVNVPLDSWITSNSVTITGIEIATPISTSNGEYSIGCNGTFTATAGSISNGQSVCIRQRSANALNTSKTSTLIVGSVSDDFTTTTATVEDSTPDQFTFTDQTGLSRNATVRSNTITISGLTVPAAITVSGSGGYSIGCTNTFINTAGTISNGDTVCLSHLASNAYSTTVTTTLTIGGIADTFTSTTAAKPSGGGGGGGGSLDLNVLALLCLLTFIGGRPLARTVHETYTR